MQAMGASVRLPVPGTRYRWYIYTGNESTLYCFAIFGTFSTGFRPPKPGIPCIGCHNVISHLIFFQYNMLYYSNARLTLYWQWVSMSSPIEGENISGYHSDLRCSFISHDNIIQYKLFPVLDSVYFPIQGGDILQFKVTPVLVFGCTMSHPNIRS